MQRLSFKSLPFLSFAKFWSYCMLSHNKLSRLQTHARARGPRMAQKKYLSVLILIMENKKLKLLFFKMFIHHLLITEGFVTPSGWSRPSSSWFLAANLLSISRSGESRLWEQALGSSSSPPGQWRMPSQTRYEAIQRLVRPHVNWESLLHTEPVKYQIISKCYYESM